MDTMPRVREQSSRPMAQLQRDAALQRLSRVRRWTLIGAAGLTAGAAALVSAVAPGRSFGAKARPPVPNTTTTATTSTARPKMPPLASASQLGLQGPAEAPQAAPAPQSSPAPAPAPAPAQAAPTPAPAQSSAPPVSGGSCPSAETCLTHTPASPLRRSAA